MFGITILYPRANSPKIGSSLLQTVGDSRIISLLRKIGQDLCQKRFENNEVLITDDDDSGPHQTYDKPANLDSSKLNRFPQPSVTLSGFPDAPRTQPLRPEDPLPFPKPTPKANKRLAQAQWFSDFRYRNTKLSSKQVEQLAAWTRGWKLTSKSFKPLLQDLNGWISSPSSFWGVQDWTIPSSTVDVLVKGDKEARRMRAEARSLSKRKGILSFGYPSSNHS